MTMEIQAETVEERAEVARDLQVEARRALGVENERQEWTITDASPRRKLYVLYSTTTGERIEVPRFIFDTAIKRMVPGTNQFAFTAFKDRAPVYKPGAVKCFLHPESPERDALTEIGIFATCNAAELRNQHSKRMHAQHRHRDEWAALQEHIQEQERQTLRDEQRQQLNATLELARAANSRGGKAAT